MSTVREEWGLSCPKCGSDEHLEVELTTMAKITPDGTDPIGDQLWDETSYTRCDHCGHEGKLARFYSDDEVQS